MEPALNFNAGSILLYLGWIIHGLNKMEPALNFNAGSILLYLGYKS